MEHLSSIEALGSQLEKFISTKTVFGEPVVAGRVTLIPIQSVSFGFGSGSGKGGNEKDTGAGAGSGGGAALRPLAIVAVRDDGDVQVFTFEGRGIADKIIERLPEVISKVSLAMPKSPKPRTRIRTRAEKHLKGKLKTNLGHLRKPPRSVNPGTETKELIAWSGAPAG